MTTLRAAFAIGATLALLTGCRANGKIQASADAKTGAELDEELNVEWGDDGAAAGRSEQAALAGDEGLPEDGSYALIGARPDVVLQDGAGAVCGCVRAHVGQPGDAGFFWQTVIPRTSSEQLVIAFTSEGVACAGAKESSLGASYAGYTRSGDDVVVLLETALPGRQRVEGAIIPRPQTGRVFLRPRRSSPYGRGPSNGSCPITGGGP